MQPRRQPIAFVAETVEKPASVAPRSTLHPILEALRLLLWAGFLGGLYGLTACIGFPPGLFYAVPIGIAVGLIGAVGFVPLLWRVPARRFFGPTVVSGWIVCLVGGVPGVPGVPGAWVMWTGNGYHSAPFWFLLPAVVGFAAVMLCAWQTGAMYRREMLVGCCESCGYSLEGLDSSVCPECGSENRPVASARGSLLGVQ